MLDPLQLIRFFYEDPTVCGQFTQVPSAALPPAYISLLDHNDHMTVTIEAFHDSMVDVQVLAYQQDDVYYTRSILLKRRTDGQVVQFGIVRLTLALLDDPIRREIEASRTPLGRILIKHHVMRRVELDSLWQVTPGPELCRFFSSDEPTFGRTAWIHVNGQPAVELLEIVAPAG